MSRAGVFCNFMVKPPSPLNSQLNFPPCVATALHVAVHHNMFPLVRASFAVKVSNESTTIECLPFSVPISPEARFHGVPRALCYWFFQVQRPCVSVIHGALIQLDNDKLLDHTNKGGNKAAWTTGLESEADAQVECLKYWFRKKWSASRNARDFTMEMLGMQVYGERSRRL